MINWLLPFVGFKAGAAWTLVGLVAALLVSAIYGTWRTAEANELEEQLSVLDYQYRLALQDNKKLKKDIVVLDNVVRMQSRQYLELSRTEEELETRYEDALDIPSNKEWFDTPVPPDFLGGMQYYRISE